MNHKKIVKELVNLEAVLDQHLFASPSRDEDEHQRSRRNTGRAAEAAGGGAVVIGTGAAARHVLKHHYGAGQMTGSISKRYGQAARNAGRDVGDRASMAGKSAVSKVRNSDAGYKVEGKLRNAENSVREGARNARAGLKKGVKKVARMLDIHHPLARRIVELSDRMDSRSF